MSSIVMNIEDIINKVNLKPLTMGRDLQTKTTQDENRFADASLHYPTRN
jgi:hypothetical protein